MERKIALASDHAGFERKQAVIRYLVEKQIPHEDLGCYSSDPCDYPDFAHKIAGAISFGLYPIGITFCGTGQGISITTNRYPKIRSALCWNTEIARLARQHNDANICAIPGRYVTDNEAIEIINVFLDSSFEGGRHQQRINKISGNYGCI
jgi:ribose 5-phosphate isomerase B